MMRFFMLVKLGMPKLRRLSNLILRLLPSIGPFEYLANLGLAAFVKGGFKLSFYGGLKMYDLGV